jgi:plastocyanin
VVVRPRFLIRLVLAAAVVAAAVLLAGCGGSSSTGAGSSSTGAGSSATSTAAASAPLSGHVKIDISNFMYSPAVIKVKVGSTITVTNEDETEHTATSNSEGAFDTGTLTKGQSMSFKVNKVGTFSYHCSFHAFMHGTIEVVQ